jgi:copper homeostasis protein (lipoprotein)
MNQYIRLLFLSILIAAACFSLGSCQGTKATQATGSNPDPAHNSKNALDWEGVYTGVLPCADCEGIQTLLELNRNQTYRLEAKYLGKSEEAYSTEGTFRWAPSGNSIELDLPEKGSSPFNYAVGENVLTQLDLQGQRITGTLAERYRLIKQPSGLVEKYWKLIELNGKEIPDSPQQLREAHIILKAIESRVVGNSGCNNFSGSYQLDAGNRLSFSRVAATKMACLHNTIENELFEVLERADNYTLRNDTLSLNKARMAPLARFVAAEKQK